MGIIDLHFHESKIKFAPHIGSKASEETEEREETTGIKGKAGTDKVAEPDARTSAAKTVKSSTAARGIGVLVALAFLVGVGVLVRKVSGGEEETAESGEIDTEEGAASIDVSDD